MVKRDGRLGDGVFGPIKYVRVFVGPTPIIVTSPDSLQNARVTGGPVTADYQRLEAATKRVTTKMDSFGTEVKKASAEERKSPEFTAQEQAQFDAITKEYAQSDRDFIKANPILSEPVRAGGARYDGCAPTR